MLWIKIKFQIPKKIFNSKAKVKGILLNQDLVRGIGKWLFR